VDSLPLFNFLLTTAAAAAIVRELLLASQTVRGEVGHPHDSLKGIWLQRKYSMRLRFIQHKVLPRLDTLAAFYYTAVLKRYLDFNWVTLL
jgi:hypothetical protein